MAPGAVLPPPLVLAMAACWLAASQQHWMAAQEAAGTAGSWEPLSVVAAVAAAVHLLGLLRAEQVAAPAVAAGRLPAVQPTGQAAGEVEAGAVRHPLPAQQTAAAGGVGQPPVAAAARHARCSCQLHSSHLVGPSHAAAHPALHVLAL